MSFGPPCEGCALQLRETVGRTNAAPAMCRKSRRMQIITLPPKLEYGQIAGSRWAASKATHPPCQVSGSSGYYQRWGAVTAAGGNTGGAANSVGSSPVRLLRNDMMSLISASPSFIPGCTRPMTFTASASVATDPSWKYGAVIATLRRLGTLNT